MGDISANFNRSEFACKCGCGFAVVDTELLEVLEGVRQYFCEPVSITSGNRCWKHNKKVGGADHSKHALGIAADIKVANVEPQDVYDYLDRIYPDRYGIGLYSGWVHIDVREEIARW